MPMPTPWGEYGRVSRGGDAMSDDLGLVGGEGSAMSSS